MSEILTNEPVKIAQALKLVAGISAILGPSWKLSVLDDNPAEWADAAGVSWHPDSSPDAYPIAVDFYSEMGGEGPCEVQMFHPSHDAINPEIREKIAAVQGWCKANNILHGFEQV